jgi:hypothetical protein
MMEFLSPVHQAYRRLLRPQLLHGLWLKKHYRTKQLLLTRSLSRLRDECLMTQVHPIKVADRAGERLGIHR